MTTARPADSTTRARIALRRFVLVAVWLPVLLVAIGVAVQLALLPQAPASIAVHWNAAGDPDRFAPAWTQPLTTIAFGLGLPLLIALTSLPGLRRGDRGMTYRLMGATAAGLSALVTVAFTWTFVTQVGLGSSTEAPTVWAALVASFVAAAVVGVAAWFIQPREEATDAAAQPATPLALTPNERALWMRVVGMSRGAAITIVAAVVLIAASAVVAWVTGAEPLLAWILTGVALLLLVFAATTLAFHVRVDDTGLHVDSVLGLPRLHVPLADVVSASHVTVNPVGEFGGWGLRLGSGRRFGVVLRTGEAIEVLRRSGKRFVVTVDDAGTGAALLEALVERDAARS
jgi:MFS family permease